MNKIEFNELATLAHADKLTVYSLERMLYQASLTIDQSSYWITDTNGTPMRFQHTDEIREAVEHLQLGSAVMQLPTTFDEMIGRAAQQANHPCEIPLGW